MKYQLIKEINTAYNATQQILTNRGIDFNNIEHYLNTTDDDINKPAALGERELRAAGRHLVHRIKYNEDVLIIVDCDCDGFCSSAILINYLYELCPAWVENHLHYFLHEDKTHGLKDCIDYINNKNFTLVILPDAGSNDYQYHEELNKREINIIILDHHEAEKISENAIVINNQLCDYPNKNLSGAGVTWQFCRYINDNFNNPNKPDTNDLLDLVALGNMADMMSMTSIETKHIINKGFSNQYVKNPFIHGMAQKNSYSLGNKITPMGAAFYIAPFVNAMVRSGTLEEKELLFKSMLKHKAFKQIPSNKRGHKQGEMESILDQALRTATNVKNRQTRAQDAAMALFENRIERDNMMDNKVLLFLAEPGEVDKNIAGLCANKIMAKYQRPCCILTKKEEIDETMILTSNPPQTYKYMTYQGSARGCDKIGVNNFKDICTETGCIMYAEGHQGAFGLGIEEVWIDKFVELTNEALKDMSDEPVYYVDYIYKGCDVQSQDILDIATLDNLWGKDMDEPYIVIQDLAVIKDMITLMSPDKKPTLKITLPNKVSLIKFGSSQEEYESLLSEGSIVLDIVGRCNANEWNGWVTPQLIIEDYEIKSKNKYCF